MNKQEKVNQIRSQYDNIDRTSSLDKLKALDNKVKAPAQTFGLIFGIIGALILGLGMCLAMKIIGNSIALGVVIGVVGIAMVSVNYFIYKSILNKRKKEYADEIIALSDKVLSSND